MLRGRAGGCRVAQQAPAGLLLCALFSALGGAAAAALLHGLPYSPISDVAGAPFSTRLRLYSISGCQLTTTQQLLNFSLSRGGALKVMLGLYISTDAATNNAVRSVLDAGDVQWPQTMWHAVGIYIPGHLICMHVAMCGYSCARPPTVNGFLQNCVHAGDGRPQDAADNVRQPKCDPQHCGWQRGAVTPRCQHLNSGHPDSKVDPQVACVTCSFIRHNNGMYGSCVRS